MMNEPIAKIEALTDCLHLLTASGPFSDAFKEAIRQERHFALMANTVRPHTPQSEELLSYCRTASNDERVQAKLALALGLMALSGVEALGDWSSTREEAVNRDAYMYRLYYAGENGDAPLADSVRALFKAMRQRNTIELHTFVANTSTVDGWIEQISAWDRESIPELDAFAKAVSEPNTHEPQGFGGDAFYSVDDALLQLILLIRRGAQVDSEALQAALSVKPSSSYGQAVWNGYQQLLRANAFFTETAV